MTNKNFFRAVLAAIWSIVFVTGVVSCKENDTDNGGSNESDVPLIENEQEALGWRLISMLTDEGTAPSGWQDKTFEPTIGKAVDGDPYTRVVSTNDVDAAAARFAELADNPAGFSEVMSAYSYSVEGIGKLTYKRGSETESYLAQVDVDLKQVPHLKKILYQTPAQQGNNATVTGTAYYRFGDVVKDSEGSYWVCVRPSFGPEGKGDSHWISVSMPLPKKNIYEYHGNNNDYYLPTGLGESVEHMQNLCEMLYAMLYPTQWNHNLASSPRPKMFHDFSYGNYKYHNVYFWKVVENTWSKQNLYQTVFNCTKEQLMAAMDDTNKGLNFVYSGKSWPYGWEGGVYHAQFTNGSGKESNMHKLQKSTVKKNLKNMPIDFRQQVDQRLFDNDGRLRFVLRYKTGKQLSDNGRYDPKTAISGATDVYVYNKVHHVELTDDPEVLAADDFKDGALDGFYGDSYYRIGDVVKDEDGALWFCVQHAGLYDETIREVYKEYGEDADRVLNEEHVRIWPSQYSWFVSLTPESSKGKSLFEGNSQYYYTNLPTFEQAKTIASYFSYILQDGPWGKRGDNSGLGRVYQHIKNYAKVDLAKVVVRRDSLFDAFTNGQQKNHIQNIFVNLAYSDATHAAKKKQGYLRFLIDCCVSEYDENGNPRPGTRLNCNKLQDAYTTGNYTTKMFLQDLTDAGMVKQYAYDQWVTLPWYTYGNAFAGQKTDKALDIYMHESIRTDSYSSISPEMYLWDPQKMDYAGSYTSMYNEPIAMVRVMKVKDRGTKPTHTGNGKKILAEYLCDNEKRDQCANNGHFMNTFTSVTSYFNGQKASDKFILFLGE